MIDGQLYNAQWMSYNFSGLRYYIWDDMQVVEKQPDQIVIQCTLAFNNPAQPCRNICGL